MQVSTTEELNNGHLSCYIRPDMLPLPSKLLSSVSALTLCGVVISGCGETTDSDSVTAEPTAALTPAVNPPLVGQAPTPAATGEAPPAMPSGSPSASPAGEQTPAAMPSMTEVEQTPPSPMGTEPAPLGTTPTAMPSMTGVEQTPPAPMGTEPAPLGTAPAPMGTIPPTGMADSGGVPAMDAGAAMPTPEPEVFNPCPTNGEPCRIMPMGDSITSGARSSHAAGYRPGLFLLMHADNKAFTFVGSAENGPRMVGGMPFERNHEGHSGWTIDDGARNGLFPQVANWLRLNPPNVILLMIGTNDVNLELDLANAGRRLELLVDRIIENAPDALLVLAQIVPTNIDAQNQRVRTFNAAIPGIVASRAELGKHITMVDMYGAFVADQNYKNSILADKLHPNDAGYTKMAEVWYEAIEPLVPTAN